MTKKKHNGRKNIKTAVFTIIGLLCILGLLPDSISGRLTGALNQDSNFRSAYTAVSEAVSDAASGYLSDGLPGTGLNSEPAGSNDNGVSSGDGTGSADSSSAGSYGALPDDARLEVNFLDVGQGLSVLVNADGHFMLYDGGDRTASSFVVACLKDKGVTDLDYLVASHYDADHLNGLVGALHVFNTALILGPDYETETKIYGSFLNIVKELGKEIKHPAPGEQYPLGGGYFEILAPLSDRYDDVNNYSIAIRLVYGDTSFLIMGDAEKESEKEMTEYWPDLSADVLCVGHHGSPTSTGDELLDRVNPSIAVISCGRNNSYGHPGKDVLERLEKHDISVLRTDESGTVTITSDGSELTVSSPAS